MRPIIGLLGDIDGEKRSVVRNTYTHAFDVCGATSVIIPYTFDRKTSDDIVELCDGFCFTGGVDVDPLRYQEQVTEYCGEINLLRDEFEIAMFKRIYDARKPIIAICRGVQLVNVAMGGTLYQDIAEEKLSSVQHVQNGNKLSYCHTVQIFEDSPLFNIIGSAQIKVNSFHHQSVKRVAPGLNVMATCDGVIEGLYADGFYLMGYQWHPELLVDFDVNARKIFEDFIRKCEPHSRV